MLGRGRIHPLKPSQMLVCSWLVEAERLVVNVAVWVFDIPKNTCSSALHHHWCQSKNIVLEFCWAFCRATGVLLLGRREINAVFLVVASVAQLLVSEQIHSCWLDARGHYRVIQICLFGAETCGRLNLNCYQYQVPHQKRGFQSTVSDPNQSFDYW